MICLIALVSSHDETHHDRPEARKQNNHTSIANRGIVMKGGART